MFPNFLGIGAQKSGTTWLHTMLSAHKEIWLPHLKELHYFDRKFPITETGHTGRSRAGRGAPSGLLRRRLKRFSAEKLRDRLSIGRWGDLAWEFRYLTGDWSDDWYASLFEQASGRIAGEITPAYSCLGEAAIAHVHGLMPDAKLILLLRDPIDRAWSQAKMDLARNRGRTPGDVTESEYLAHFDDAESRLRGDYVGSISRWLAKYKEEQLFVGFFEEIHAEPGTLLTRILRFVGASAGPENIPANVHSAVNVGQRASIPRKLHAHLAATYMDDMRALAGRYGRYPQSWVEQCERALSD